LISQGLCPASTNTNKTSKYFPFVVENKKKTHTNRWKSDFGLGHAQKWDRVDVNAYINKQTNNKTPAEILLRS